MFSLIISIIAIALVVVLAGASLYYGGDAFNQGTSKGEAAKMINEASQIQGAYTMHKVDQKGAEPADVDELVTDKYLAAAPATAWTLGTGAAGSEVAATEDQTVVFATADSADICDQVNLADNHRVSCDTGTLNVAYSL